MSVADDPFVPRWASPPGATIKAVLDERQLSFTEFAHAIDVPTERAKRLLEGQDRISLHLARQLAQVIGSSPEFWIARDGQYQDDVARVAANAWVESLPTREMTKLGWMEPVHSWVDRIDRCFDFFGVRDLESWRLRYGSPLADARYRLASSADIDQGTLAVWLRKAELDADAQQVRPWHAATFSGALAEARRLTRRSDPRQFVPALQELCAEAGVIVSVLRPPRRCPISGAARRLDGDRAQIILTGRYLADDHLWFTFFHEAAHLLLHDASEVYVDQLDWTGERVDADDEREADAFAADVLVPPEVRSGFPTRKPTPRDVKSLADRAGVAPGIVVGQMQHARILGFNSVLNRLKRHYKWAGSSLEMA